MHYYKFLFYFYITRFLFKIQQRYCSRYISEAILFLTERCLKLFDLSLDCQTPIDPCFIESIYPINSYTGGRAFYELMYYSPIQVYNNLSLMSLNHRLYLKETSFIVPESGLYEINGSFNIE